MDNVESRVKELEGKMERVLKILEGNGKPGLIKEFADNRNAFEKFLAVWESREKDKMIYDDRQEILRKEQQERSDKKFNRVIALLSLLLVLVGTIVGVLTYERASGHALLVPIHSSDIYNAEAFEQYNSRMR